MLFGTLPPSMAALLRVVAADTSTTACFSSRSLVAVGATLLFALVPALQASRLTLTDALHGERTGTPSGSRLRSTLVVGQVAVSLVLVVAALTLARNGASLGAIDLGFQTQGVFSINVRGDEDALVRPLAEALAADPRVAELAVTGGNPCSSARGSVAAAPASSSAPGIGRRHALHVRVARVLPDPADSDSCRGAVQRRTRRARRRARGDRQRGDGEGVLARRRSDWTDHPHRAAGRPPGERASRLLRGHGRRHRPRRRERVASSTGRTPGISTCRCTPRIRTRRRCCCGRGPDRELGPSALQEIFRRVAPDPQVFEADTARRHARGADVSAPRGVVDRHAARRPSRWC